MRIDQSAETQFPLKVLTQSSANLRMLLPDHVYGKAFCDEWHRKMCPRRGAGLRLSVKREDALMAFLLMLFSRDLRVMEFVGSVRLPESDGENESVRRV